MAERGGDTVMRAVAGDAAVGNAGDFRSGNMVPAISKAGAP